MFLVLLAACGAPAKRKPGKVEPINSADKLVEVLEAYAEVACACKDRECADELDARIEARLRATPPAPFLHDDQFPDIEAAAHLTLRCLWEHGTLAYSLAQLTVSGMTQVRDETCACVDRACLDEVGMRSELRVLHLFAVPMTAERRAEVEAIGKETAGCQAQELP
jgi:hypothetical protein